MTDFNICREEIQVDGYDLQSDSDKLLRDLLSEKERQKEYIDTLQQQASTLLDLTVKQDGEITSLRARAKAKITEMKAEVRQEIKAVELILKAIQDGQSSHWQKEENIRLALEILATIPTFDRHDEDDF
jgi:predicted  nucleic acid-binding Zn-ribbon protein